MSTGTSHQKDPEKARPAGIFSRRDMLLTGIFHLRVFRPLTRYANYTRPRPVGNARGTNRSAAQHFRHLVRRHRLLEPSVYHRGMMGYQTPNIDSIASQGALFADWYGQQSCTAGRAAFLTGQSPIRTGLTKVGLPGADLGLKKTRQSRSCSSRSAT
jgi:hypothetical protein